MVHAKEKKKAEFAWLRRRKKGRGKGYHLGKKEIRREWAKKMGKAEAHRRRFATGHYPPVCL